MKPSFDELKKAAEPLIELLNQFGNPYTSVVVSCDSIEVIEITTRIPLEIKD